MDVTSPRTLGLAVAVGCGLLIGIERERRKGSGANREAAGLRTFAIVAGAGGLAQWIDLPGLVIAGALLVAVLSALAYTRSQRGGPAPDVDPGLTTEIALFATYLVGIAAVRSPVVGAACGAGLAGLLAARERLHRFATQWLNEQELHDGLLLAALALIALPLVPATPIAGLGGVALRPVAFLVVLILVLQAVAHVALRLLGARGGLLLVGFLSGFVSSTATVATLGRRARVEPVHARACAAGAGMSGAATWVLAIIVAGSLAPSAAALISPAALMGAVVAAALASWPIRHGHAAVSAAAPRPAQGPLRLREALVLAALLLGISAAVAALTRSMGAHAALPGAALAALADAHAAIAALASLTEAGTLPGTTLRWGMLLAIATNTVMRVAVAATTGGAAYAGRVAVPLVGSLAVAAAVTALRP